MGWLGVSRWRPQQWATQPLSGERVDAGAVYRCTGVGLTLVLDPPPHPSAPSEVEDSSHVSEDSLSLVTRMITSCSWL